MPPGAHVFLMTVNSARRGWGWKGLLAYQFYRGTIPQPLVVAEPAGSYASALLFEYMAKCVSRSHNYPYDQDR